MIHPRSLNSTEISSVKAVVSRGARPSGGFGRLSSKFIKIRAIAVLSLL
jgi:hypothetical protein